MPWAQFDEDEETMIDDQPSVRVTARQKVWEQPNGRWAVITQVLILTGATEGKPFILDAGFNHRSEKDARVASARAIQKQRDDREVTRMQESQPWEEVGELPVVSSDHPSPPLGR